MQANRYIIHISDIHVDPLFDPTQSMQTKVCHTCNMSNKVSPLPIVYILFV